MPNAAIKCRPNLSSAVSCMYADNSAVNETIPLRESVNFRRCLHLLILITAIVVGIPPCFSQATPIKATICQLMDRPSEFDGTMVSVDARILSNFEIFVAVDPSDANCEKVWVEMGNEAWTTTVALKSRDPNIQRSPIRLRQNSAFKRFAKLVRAEVFPRTQGSRCIGCNRYDVTARLTARFDFASGHGGFGHLNGWSGRLVVESVSDVRAKDLLGTYDPAQYSGKPVKFPTAEFHIKIIGPDGMAVDGINVSAISVENVPVFMKETVEHTDEKGRTKIIVPPGSYKVGVNLFYPPSPEYPFEPTYVPGTQDEARATLFEMMNGDRKRITLRMDRSLTSRKIPVQVVWMDGRSVSNASVWLVEATDPETVVGHTVSHTDADGRYDLIGLAGREYLIKAGIHVRPAYKHHCAEPMAVPAGDDQVEPIVLELRMVGEDCRDL